MTVSPYQQSQLEEANLGRTKPGGSSLLPALLSYELCSMSQELPEKVFCHSQNIPHAKKYLQV